MFLDSSPLLEDPELLRLRAQGDGLLYLRGLLPRQDVLDVRADVLDVIQRDGWLREDWTAESPTVDQAAYRRAMDADGGNVHELNVPVDLYRRIQSLESFHSLAIHPRLLELYATLFGGPVLPHPRNIARVQVPSPGNKATPAHQDFIFIQGTSKTWTAWIPLGDAPVELGPLTVLAGSQREGVLDYHTAGGAGGMEAYLCGLDYVWTEGPFAAGDVLTFESQTVHKALPNRTEAMRLSADFRYQPAHEPVTPESLQTHGNFIDWPEIYDGWSQRYPRYYWRKDTLELSEFDPLVRWQKHKIC
ncbi:MAG: hypothetical protein JWQ77_2349 [Jatrophihabitans sp.]|nr:hypothetical protein [Jatrophihabitans sp.]